MKRKMGAEMVKRVAAAGDPGVSVLLDGPELEVLDGRSAHATSARGAASPKRSRVRLGRRPRP